MGKVIIVAVALCASTALPAVVETLQAEGPADQRINVSILGDGYTAAQQSQLSSDARQLVENWFAVTPYRDYRVLFNVSLVHLISAQSGVTDGSQGGTRNTALGAAYGCEGIESGHLRRRWRRQDARRRERATTTCSS